MTVDGRRVNIPSYQIRANQVIAAGGEKSAKFLKPIVANKEAPQASWLSFDPERLTGRVLRGPSPDDVKDIPCNTQLIVELYSR